MNSPQNGNANSKNPTDAMRALRMRIIATPASEIGIQKTDEYPSVYGVLMEFPIGDFTATVVSMCNGNASLYTTSTFGMVGGYAHDNVRAAAVAFVKAAASAYDDAFLHLTFPILPPIESVFTS